MGTTSRRRSDRRKAWWSLALLPPAFVGAFVVGEGLVALYGFEAHGDLRPPLWVVLGAGVPALLVFSVPAALSAHFGRRALAAGDLRARTPMAIGIAVTLLFVGQNLLVLLVG